ncbi:MAG: alpha/beta hydrolase [Chloroflexota bacterium]|nr:alpha/beta hydrolase [Chloroflexota bacterium]
MVPTLNAVELPNRVRIPYVEQGDRRGIPVLLLHGYGDSWHSFNPMFPYLPPSIRAIAPTLRGFGDAGRSETGYTVDDFANDVLAFMDALNIQAAVLAGHSMGSMIAQRVAMQYPERTLGLLLIGSATTFQDNLVVRELNDVVATLSDPIDPDFVREFQTSMFTRPAPPAFLDTLVAESLKAPAHVWKSALAGILAIDFSDKLSRIDAPTIIVWGDQDPICPRAEQEALLAGIRDSRLVVYRDMGHAPNWEEPMAVTANLIDLIGRIAD